MRPEPVPRTMDWSYPYARMLPLSSWAGIVNESGLPTSKRCRIGAMRAWTPQTLYDAKPWVLIGLGVILAVGAMLWSLSAGLWTVWRGLLCFAGAEIGRAHV